MKIKMLTTSASPNGSYQVGQEATVSEKEAKELVYGGYATYVEKEKINAEDTALTEDKKNAKGKKGAKKAGDE